MGRLALLRLANLLGLPAGSTPMETDDTEPQQAPQQGCPATLLHALVLASELERDESLGRAHRVVARSLVG